MTPGEVVGVTDTAGRVHLFLPLAQLQVGGADFALAAWEGEGLAVLRRAGEGWALETDAATVAAVEAAWEARPEPDAPQGLVLQLGRDDGPPDVAAVESVLVREADGAAAAEVIVVKDPGGGPDPLFLRLTPGEGGLVHPVTTRAEAEALAADLTAGRLRRAVDGAELLAACAALPPLRLAPLVERDGVARRVLEERTVDGRTWLLVESDGPLPGVHGPDGDPAPLGVRAAVLRDALASRPAWAVIDGCPLEGVEAVDGMLRLAVRRGDRVVRGAIVDGAFREL